MKFLFGLLIFGLTINQATAAEVIAEKAVTATHFNVEEETEYKPWSLNMGISTLDGIDMNEQKMRGQGVTLNLQREILEHFEMGASFTNYTLTANKQAASYSSGRTAHNTNIIDLFAEFHPIQLDLIEGYSFFAAVNGGASYDSESSLSPFFYGIGMSLDYNRQIGIRADVKTYLSKGNVNNISLVGYF